MTAGLLCSISLLISSFAHRIEVLYFSYGILFGLSAGTILNAGFTITTKYFKKGRALATGIAVSGASIGVMVQGPLIEELVQQLGWRKSFRVMGGAMLLICLSSTTYDPVIDEDADQDTVLARDDTDRRPWRTCLTIVNFSVFSSITYSIGIIAIVLTYFGLFVPNVHLVRK